MNALVIVLVWLTIFIFSHLITDKDFPETTKTGAFAVIIIVGILYIIFGIFVGG